MLSLEENLKFVSLTEPQKAFITEYLRTEDVVAAAKKAYKVTTNDSAATMGHRALKHPVISKILKQYGATGDDRVTRDELLNLLSVRLRTCEDASLALEFADRIIRIEGWATKPADAVKTKDNRDELIAAL